jgi:hypothetical protein
MKRRIATWKVTNLLQRSFVICNTLMHLPKRDEFQKFCPCRNRALHRQLLANSHFRFLVTAQLATSRTLFLRAEERTCRAAPCCSMILLTHTAHGGNKNCCCLLAGKCARLCTLFFILFIVLIFGTPCIIISLYRRRSTQTCPVHNQLKQKDAV